jgi:acyl-CoA thioester hydrolase
MLQSKTTIRVRYADTDQMKFVYNGKYFEYFEVGRSEMMREIGLTYKSIEESGYHMPVHKVHIDYKSAAFYDEELEIETTLVEIPKLVVHIDHKIRSVDRNVVILTGYVELVFIRAETMRACKPPEIFLNAIKKYYE